jgi:probable F420-dependent oxidoreductase
MYFLPSEHLVPIARAIDELGFAGVTISDHLFYPRELSSRYTYSPFEDGSPPWPPETEYPDAWCLISAMAAVTQKLRFTTSVYVAPARNLFSLAKAAGTAAFLSGDRVQMGVGAGWCKEEFDAAEQDFSDRGSRLNDMIPALRALWQGGWVSYQGSHYTVPSIQMNPAPRRPIPIYAGGYSEAAIRRATRLCDGWICATAHTVDEARHHVGAVREMLARSDRGTASDFRMFVGLPGPPDLDAYRQLADDGVTDFVVAPVHAYGQAAGQTGAALLRACIHAAERFATEIIAQVAE